MYGRKGYLGYMTKMHVHSNPLLCLQLGILLGLKCGMVRDRAREVSLEQVSCRLMYVYVTPPTQVGEWSMALVLLQCAEYYCYYRLAID